QWLHGALAVEVDDLLALDEAGAHVTGGDLPVLLVAVHDRARVIAGSDLRDSLGQGHADTLSRSAGPCAAGRRARTDSQTRTLPGFFEVGRPNSRSAAVSGPARRPRCPVRPGMVTLPGDTGRVSASARRSTRRSPSDHPGIIRPETAP